MIKSMLLVTVNVLEIDVTHTHTYWGMWYRNIVFKAKAKDLISASLKRHNFIFRCFKKSRVRRIDEEIFKKSKYRSAPNPSMIGEQRLADGCRR
jgi:hypothetical protein